MPELPFKKKLSKIVPKQKIVPDPEEEEIEELDEEEGEEEEQELAPVAKKKRVLPVVEEENDIEMEPPKKKVALKKPTRGLSALAKAFAAVPLSTKAANIKAGTYEAVIRSITLQDADAKGQSVRINAELCAEEFAEANQLVDWRKLMDANEEPIIGGWNALSNDLARLGYELPEKDEDFDENLEAIFDAITKEKPGVIVKVIYQHVNGVDYQHFAIHSECDNSVVQAYKEQRPY